jgi:hypothetical protein
VSLRQLHLGVLSVLCGLTVLLGIYLILGQRTAVKFDSQPVKRNASILLDDERRRLAAGSWQAFPVNVPSQGLLEIEIRVVRGNPVDVALMDGNQLDSLANKGWNQATRNPAFTANRTETYHVTAEIEAGNYYLVYRDATLGVLSAIETDVTVKITLNFF